MQQALKQVQEYLDSDAFRESISAADKIDVKKISAELNKAKIELEKNRKSLKPDMDKVRAEIEKTKQLLLGYQEMIGLMEQDDLLNANDDYRISMSNGDLYVNGKKQPEALAKKYSHYFEKNGTTITRKNGSFTISIE